MTRNKANVGTVSLTVKAVSRLCNRRFNEASFGSTSPKKSPL
jgi:hypothetical protein